MSVTVKCPACEEVYESGGNVPHDCKGSSMVQTEPVTPEQHEQLKRALAPRLEASAKVATDAIGAYLEKESRRHEPLPPPDLEDRVKALELVVDAYERRFLSLEAALRASALRDVR